MDIEEMRKRLALLNEKDISISDHTLVRCFQREITKALIVENLLNPEGLIDIIEEVSDRRGKGSSSSF
jgi:hypothetical protein